MEELPKPKWLHRGNVDEVEFCQEFLVECMNLKYMGNSFFSLEGRVRDEFVIKKAIYDRLSPHFYQGLSRKVESIFSTLKLECGVSRLAQSDAVIHVANGTYDLNNGFSEYKQFCRNRLPVVYDPALPNPDLWLAFLDDLLEPEDIKTLQEFMGYCLLPTTVAQKMLIITGRGGEGKSRIGIVMRALLGENMTTNSIAKIESNPFARADLEHTLLMVDDDLNMQKLKSTDHLKSIITAEQPMDLERKGIQSYQGQLYVRFMAFGNDTLQALYDRSHGFFRRQIILSAKPRRADRVDNPFLGQLLKKERDSIFLWCLLGLFRLLENDMCFTLSEGARENMRSAVADSNNVVDFMRSRDYFLLDDTSAATSRLLYKTYERWCEDNMATPLNSKSFSSYLIQNADTYGLTYSCNIPGGNGTHVRGFQGIRVLPRA